MADLDKIEEKVTGLLVSMARIETLLTEHIAAQLERTRKRDESQQKIEQKYDELGSALADAERWHAKVAGMALAVSAIVSVAVSLMGPIR